MHSLFSLPSTHLYPLLQRIVAQVGPYLIGTHERSNGSHSYPISQRTSSQVGRGGGSIFTHSLFSLPSTHSYPISQRMIAQVIGAGAIGTHSLFSLPSTHVYPPSQRMLAQVIGGAIGTHSRLGSMHS